MWCLTKKDFLTKGNKKISYTINTVIFFKKQKTENTIQDDVLLAESASRRQVTSNTVFLLKVDQKVNPIQWQVVRGMFQLMYTVQAEIWWQQQQRKVIKKIKKSPEISCILMCPGPPGVLSRVILHIKIGAESHLTVIHQPVG